MNLDRVGAGKDLPNDFNVIIEISANSVPVKYEVDKETGALFVDRFMTTTMQYPGNYGYIPDTLGEDGDPLDVLVVTSHPLIPGCVVRCRPLGMLVMSDESGGDSKVIAAPVKEQCAIHAEIESTADLSKVKLELIAHFFEHYKDLDPGKWVKVEHWASLEETKAEITRSVERYVS